MCVFGTCMLVSELCCVLSARVCVLVYVIMCGSLVLLESCLWKIQIGVRSRPDPRDDLGIRTGLCSEDKTVIRTQNCIISYECLFFCIFLFTVASS